VYVLPKNEQTLEDFSWILLEIKDGGGEVSLCEAAFIDGINDEQIIAMFREARKGDYEEKLGLPTAITDIMEKHIRGGLTEAEATELGLPVKDYRLNSIEEKIVIYADRLVDIIMDGVVKTDEEAEQRFEEILATQIKYGKNDITLKRYLGYHREIQALMGN
jgi:hypothetical protein